MENDERSKCEIQQKGISCLELPHNTLSEHAIAAEFTEVCRSPVEGVFVVPSSKSKYVWNGVVFVKKGLFGGGIFRFCLLIPEEYPNTVVTPTIVFRKTIFHPLIDAKTKVLDLSLSFPDGWKSDKHSIRRVLTVLPRIFLSFEFRSDNYVNKLAALLYKESRRKFADKVFEDVETSRAEVYSEILSDKDDKSSIKLLPWDNRTHEPVKSVMIDMEKGEEKSLIAICFAEKDRQKHGIDLLDLSVIVVHDCQ
ncbi:unnamed protein product [Caenorhabditis sp. 36 PRJEB53466]|nr:unnamed protein product [Caenorhabditis sp. 36 PRJEB53466]